MSASVEISGVERLNEGINRLVGLMQGEDHQAFADIGALGESAVRNTLRVGKRDPETGEPWDDLDPDYEAWKKTKSSGGLLVFENHMLDSIDHQVDGTTVIVGTNVIYANRQDQARHFMGLSDDSAEEMLDVINDHIDAELKR